MKKTTTTKTSSRAPSAVIRRTGNRIASSTDHAADAVAVRELEAKKAWSNAKTQFKKADSKVNNYIKANPKKAAMIAAGVGAAIGAALTAAMRRRTDDTDE